MEKALTFLYNGFVLVDFGNIPMALEISSAITFVAGSWGIANILLSATEKLNERRDLAITGRAKDVQLNQAHRRLIAYGDWLPMSFALTGFFVLAILAAGKAPKLLNEFAKYADVWWNYAICAAVLTGILGLLATLLELMFIVRWIEKSPDGHFLPSSVPIAPPSELNRRFSEGGKRG